MDNRGDIENPNYRISFCLVAEDWIGQFGWYHSGAQALLFLQDALSNIQLVKLRKASPQQMPTQENISLGLYSPFSYLHYPCVCESL